MSANIEFTYRGYKVECGRIGTQGAYSATAAPDVPDTDANWKNILQTGRKMGRGAKAAATKRIKELIDQKLGPEVAEGAPG